LIKDVDIYGAKARCLIVAHSALVGRAGSAIAGFARNRVIADGDVVKKTQVVGGSETVLEALHCEKLSIAASVQHIVWLAKSSTHLLSNQGEDTAKAGAAAEVSTHSSRS